MKRFHWLATLCLAVMTLPVWANDASPAVNTDILVRANIAEGKVISLKVSNLQMEKTSIKITDLKGEKTYYRDFVKNHNGYGRRLNLNNLPAGKYVLTVKQKDEYVKQIIVIKDSYLLLSGIQHKQT